MPSKSFDLVVIGGGPGGYVAAIRASQLGLKTALVERKHYGGICLNWGCIPTKSLLQSAEVYRQVKDAKSFGVVVSEIGFDLGRMVQRSRQIVRQLRSGVKNLLQKNGIYTVDGTGRISAPDCVNVQKKDGTTLDLAAPSIVLATGARPKGLAGIEADGNRLWNSRHAMTATEVPGSLLIIGSGAVGIEFASFYNSLGTTVTVVENVDRIFPAGDEEVSNHLRRVLERRGLDFITGATVQSLKEDAGGIAAVVCLSEGKQKLIRAERVLIAVGVDPNIENIGIESTRIRTGKGGIVVDRHQRTEEANIYAVGDVTGPPALAHKAFHEGSICAESIAGVPGIRCIDKTCVPICVYADPQLASVGLTEQGARESGYAVRIGRFPFTGNGKAVSSGGQDGFVKTIFHADSGELLGAHMIGAGVTELIHGFSIAKTLESTESELFETIFPHPTLSEAMHESVLDAFGRAIHK